MKASRSSLLIGLCAAGFLGGFGGKRLTMSTWSSPSVVVMESGGRPQAVSDTPVPESPPVSAIRSSDTIDDLVALGDEELFVRLAVWLLDADESAIAAFWKVYRERENCDPDVVELVFINWARLDPPGAVAGAGGFARFAWRAWACHDPDAALAHAVATKPDRVDDVVRGIGEFHPAWLHAHFDRIPEAERKAALDGLTSWVGGGDPVETLDLLRDMGHPAPHDWLKGMIRKDPWATYDWLRENEIMVDSPFASPERPMALLIETLGASHPDILERLVQREPSGQTKRVMERVLFENLLKTDREGAITQALETKARMVAAERMATVSLDLARSDPDRAFAMVDRLLTTNPDATEMRIEVTYPDGGRSSWGESNPKLDEVLGMLLAEDPARLMEMPATEINGPEFAASWRSRIGERWAQRDLEGFAEWVSQQDDGPVRNLTVPMVAGQLDREGRFEEAVQWGMSLEGASRRSALIGSLSEWESTNPGEARDWFGTSGLSDEEKAYYQNIMEDQP